MQFLAPKVFSSLLMLNIEFDFRYLIIEDIKDFVLYIPVEEENKNCQPTNDDHMKVTFAYYRLLVYCALLIGHVCNILKLSSLYLLDFMQ